LSCVNTHVTGRQLPEPVTRCERVEENWVHPKENRPLLVPLGAKQEERVKVGPAKQRRCLVYPISPRLRMLSEE
jgi:hypothetical protein